MPASETLRVLGVEQYSPPSTGSTGMCGSIDPRVQAASMAVFTE